MTFQLINCESGHEVLISTHETKTEAQAAYRDRNKHQFDKKYARENNLEGASSFDLIFDKNGDFVSPFN